ncbi:hypothetical protein EJB05_26664, partial [Eragrostis curvula]
MDPVAVADPSPSRRSVKRRPPARSPELSPKAAGGGDDAAEELIRRVAELEAAAARLMGEKEAAEEAARALQEELDAERASAETAISEAMLMIERLQRQKAAAQMEARQFRRYAKGRADHEREVQEELATLNDLAASYHSRLRSHGIDPNSFSDEDEEEGEEVEQIDMAAVFRGGAERRRHEHWLSFFFPILSFLIISKLDEIANRHTPVLRPIVVPRVELRKEILQQMNRHRKKNGFLCNPALQRWGNIVQAFCHLEDVVHRSEARVLHGPLSMGFPLLITVKKQSSRVGRTKDRFCGGSSEKPNPSHNNNINLSPNLVVVHHNLFALVLAAVIHRWKQSFVTELLK